MASYCCISRYKDRFISGVDIRNYGDGYVHSVRFPYYEFFNGLSASIMEDEEI